MFTSLTSEKVSILFKTTVRSILEYRSTTWSPNLIKENEALGETQRTRLAKKLIQPRIIRIHITW